MNIIYNKNPIVSKKPICVCRNNTCICISVIPYNPKDSEFSSTTIVYGNSADCDIFTYEFNHLRLNNLDKFRKFRFIDKKDMAFQLISINYEEIFKNTKFLIDQVFPSTPETYNPFIKQILKNIIYVFHRDIGYNMYKWILDTFSYYNGDSKNLLQIPPYFLPSWDMFGTHKNIFDDDIVKYNIDGYEYRLSFEIYSDNIINHKDMGFLKNIPSIFTSQSGIIDTNIKMILQIMTPDGLWCRNKQRNCYSRYSDIALGYSSKGKIKIGETPLMAARRETYEEIDLMITKKESKTIMERVDTWGRIYLYKMNITGCNKIPLNPFV
jgi:hypothetical protein